MKEDDRSSPFSVFFMKLFHYLIHVCRKSRNQDSLRDGCEYFHCNVLLCVTSTGRKQVDRTDQDSKPAKDQRNVFILYRLRLFECDSDEV